MSLLQSHKTLCPYCGETIEIVLDCSVDSQQYIEDCQVCCRPFEVVAEIDENGEVHVTLYHENE
ncbi:MAG: CPXCG motif-containing cysteine-rich protein [Halioglobus sp.]|nr:CPXCG motif-containing cysteine-rich protein [Halioglobus sp.]